MKDTSIFQIVILTLCAVFMLAGIGVFAHYSNGGAAKSVGTVVIWGTMSSDAMNAVLNDLRTQNKDAYPQVTYVQKDADTYEQNIVDAIASGHSPDLALVSQEDLLPLSGKLQLIPYGSISKSTFESTFVDEGQLFESQSGVYAVPFLVDPLVLYWNRDIFAAAGIAQPPAHWSDVLNDAPQITTTDRSVNVTRSTIAMGSWQNVHDAKAVLSSLVMQAGDPIVTQGAQGPQPVFGRAPANAAENPAESAVRFYTDFANPSKTTYSWNRSLPDSQNAFLAGMLGMYLGFASEDRDLTNRNPNLRFAMALLPQATGTNTSVTYGRLWGFAVPRGSANPNGALAVAEAFAGSDADAAAASQTGTAPALRSLAVPVADDAVATVLNQSALIARGWLDPAPAQTDAIFSTMVSSIASGANTPADAVSAAAQSFLPLFSTSTQ